jgi:4-amino-4-deoxy-L-arabinose transferase-like glycosyltransferase
VPPDAQARRTARRATPAPVSAPGAPSHSHHSRAHSRQHSHARAVLRSFSRALVPDALWTLLLFGLVWITHWPLLALPYYWDEAGYYIPAAYDFFRRGTLIPYSTLSNAHPPLPSLYLAAWWRVFGFAPLVTRAAMCLVAAVALSAVYRLAHRLTHDRKAAAATSLLTGLYPVWFVQSTLAHADLLAAAGTLWGLCLFVSAKTTAGVGVPRSVHTADPKKPADSARQHPSVLSSKTAPAHYGKPDASRFRALVPASCCFALAALAKETAIATPLALAAWELWLALHARAGRSRANVPTGAPEDLPTEASEPAKHETHPEETHPSNTSLAAPGHIRAALMLSAPVIPLAAWFTYHRWRTGFLFGNPEYLRYNATSTLTPLRIALALAHRALHLTAHLNLFVPVLLTLGCLLLPRLPDRPVLASQDRARLLIVILANWCFFSILGGALLTRYLLPVYPLVLLLCVTVWTSRIRHWGGLVALSAAAFVLGVFINPPYRFAPEDTLAYRDSILLQQDAIAQILARYGRPTVLTAWPASDELTKPELGYVEHPLQVVAIDNFSYPQIRVAAERAATEGATGEPYTVALLFSTKYDPPGLLLRLEGRAGEQNQALDERYFAFHQDLDPRTIAHLLGGSVVWQEQRHGQWAAVVHFDRPQVALLAPGYADPFAPL